MSSASEEYEQYSWDGVIRHKTGPGNSGWKRWGCRCPGCYLAGQKINRQKREREKAIRDGRIKIDFKHGLDGYRVHKCRCDVCVAAGREFNASNREAGRTRGKYKSRAKNAAPDDIVGTPEPEVDWSEVAHLRPGHGVRRRSRKRDDESAA